MENAESTSPENVAPEALAAPPTHVARVVKPHHLFMRKKAGEVVMVERRYLDHASTQKATMSLEEYEASQAPKQAPPAGPTSVDLARNFTDRLKHEAEARKANEEAAAEREAIKATAAAVEIKQRKAGKKAEK